MELSKITAIIRVSWMHYARCWHAAAGILARYGFQHLSNVVGGTSAWVHAGYPVETTSAPTVQVS